MWKYRGTLPMCGIAGCVIDPSMRNGIEVATGDSVLARIRHRGPDAVGQYSDATVWLGHVRLSILDLSDAGSQPMSTANGSLVISYNGEVYNFRELASELSLHSLRSASDTEIVLRSFEKLGTSSFRKLNGIFAFALYDRRRGKLWLVRDRLGVKPLYYYLDSSGFYFASEIKAVLALAQTTPSLEASALREWLYYGNTLGGRTLYRGIHQLSPGCYIEIDVATRRTSVSEYWSVPTHLATMPTVEGPASVLITETRRLVEEAVRRQLVSDVPVGVFLSGGVDSSAITAIASKHYGGRLTTYCAGFDDLDGTDERAKARRVATHFGTDHHELHIAGSDLPTLVEKMVHHHDMPFSDAANIPLYLMAAQISGTTKVVLQGDGGDEVFGGYRRYVSLRYRRLLRTISKLGRRIWNVSSDSPTSRRVNRYFNAFSAIDVATSMALLLTPTDPRTNPEMVFSPGIRSMLGLSDPFARYRECYGQLPDGDIGGQMSAVDLMVELPDVFLEKVDRSTMAASLEVRVPFLDNDLVEYVVRIPGRRKMPWGKKKWLLKQALHGVVPDYVLYGPKTGFGVPFGYWLRTSLKPLFFDHLSTVTRRDPDFLDTQELRRRFEALEAGEHDRAYTLWNVLNLMIWYNQSAIDRTP